MIVRRQGAKGTYYMPRVYNPATQTKQTAKAILGEPSYYRTEKEAKRVHRRMQDAVEDFTPPEQTVTVSDWIKRWLEEYPRPKETSNVRYRSMIRPLVEHYGHIPLGEFTRDQARLFALDYPPHAKVAKVAFNDARYEAELIDRNPFERLKSQRTERRDLALSAGEVDLLAGCAHVLGDWGVVMRSMIVFSAYTGLRLREAMGLEWGWFSEDRSRMEVRGQMDSSGVLVCTKNGHGATRDSSAPAQVVGVPVQAREALEGLPRSLAGHVFTQRNGARITEATHKRGWHAVRKEFLALDHGRRLGELERLTWHTTRHTCATLMIEAGLSRWQASLQLRHSSPALVDSTYTHIEQGRALAEIVEAMSVEAPRVDDSTATNQDQRGGQR